uniref:Uncharacterized protein K02A2.6 n=1 Tax=Schistocephalus solidus TaxID=70667 RepID=A0A0X3PVV7_SCHSO
MYNSGKKPWVEGIVRKSKGVVFEVETATGIVKRHANQLRRRFTTDGQIALDLLCDTFEVPTPEGDTKPISPPVRQSHRKTQPPKKSSWTRRRSDMRSTFQKREVLRRREPQLSRGPRRKWHVLTHAEIGQAGLEKCAGNQATNRYAPLHRARVKPQVTRAAQIREVSARGFPA